LEGDTLTVIQCPECGAPVTEKYSCTEHFHRFLILEFSDPEYGAVHHLTVAAYMLQHPSRLSRSGWLGMRALLSRFLEEGIDPQSVRAEMRAEVDSSQRTWSLVKGPRMELPENFSWSITILSVNESDAAQYRLGIERWARQALNDAAKIRADIE
jgi:hypothetical protein